MENSQEELPSLSRAPFGREADPRFVEAMGGDKLLQEAAASIGEWGGISGVMRPLGFKGVKAQDHRCKCVITRVTRIQRSG